MGNLTRQDTEVCTPSIKAVVKMSKWTNYERGIDKSGTKFIIGSGEKPVDSFEYVETENGNLLFQLIKLYKDIYNVKNNIFSSNQQYVNDLISEDIEDIILNFCRKNGLPFWNNKRTSNIFINIESKSNDVEERIINGIPYITNQMAFPICSFLSGLNNLHTDFLNMIAFKCWNDDTFIETLLSDKDKGYVKRKMNSKRHNLYTPCLCPFITEWDYKKMSLCLKCENIMQLSVYHLCILFQSENFNGVGGHWRICDCCNQIFYATRSNQKYCRNPCTKQAVYSAKKRHKTKKPN